MSNTQSVVCIMALASIGADAPSTKRAVPVYSERLDLAPACELPGAAGLAARRLRRAHPRCETVVIVTDIRAARRLLRQQVAS